MCQPGSFLHSAQQKILRDSLTPATPRFSATSRFQGTLRLQATPRHRVTPQLQVTLQRKAEPKLQASQPHPTAPQE